MLCCCVVALFAAPVLSQKTGEYLHYRLGMRYKTEKQYDKAIDEFRKVLSEYPDNYNVYLHIAEIRFLQNQPALAIPNLKQALTYNPGWSKAHRLLADAYSKEGQIQKSIAEYQQYQQTCDPAERDSVQKVIDRLVPKIGKKQPPSEVNFDAVADKGDAAVQGQKKAGDTAAHNAAKSPQVKPVETTAVARSLEVKPIETKASIAKPEAPALTEVKPVETKTAPAKPGVKPVETKQAEAAVAVPGDPKAEDLFNRALESFRTQQYDLALKQLKEVIALQPGFPGAYYYAGLIRYERGERTLAKINLLKGKNYSEPEYNGLLYMGTIYGEEKNYPEAVRQLLLFVKKTNSENKRKQGKELLAKYRSCLGKTGIAAKADTAGAPDSSTTRNALMLTEPLMLEVRIDSLLSMVFVDTLSDAGQKLLLGIRQFQAGNFDNAVREFKKTLVLNPTGPVAAQCIYDIGVCYFKLRLLKEAENQFQQILDRYPGHELAAQSSFLKALAYSEQKESIVAERLFRSFLQTYRGHKLEGKAWEKLGDAYIDLDQPKKAIDAFAQAAGKSADFEDQVCAWYKTGNAFLAIGNTARAFSCFDSAIALGERHKVFIRVPDSYYRIADEKYKAKEYASAQAYYESVIQKYPDFQETPWALFQIGNIHKNLARFKEAIKNYNELINRFPEDYWAKQARWKLDDAVWEHEYQTTLH